MFLEKLDKLCAQKGESANAVAKKLSIASGTVSEWKKGRQPHNSTIKKLADYFGVPIEYFNDETDEKAPPEETPATIIPFFSSEEISLIYAYRSQPKLQQEVKRLLGFPEEKDYLAAETKRNHKHVKNKLDDPNTELSNKLYNARLDETDVE